MSFKLSETKLFDYSGIQVLIEYFGYLPHLIGHGYH